MLEYATISYFPAFMLFTFLFCKLCNCGKVVQGVHEKETPYRSSHTLYDLGLAYPPPDKLPSIADVQLVNSKEVLPSDWSEFSMLFFAHPSYFGHTIGFLTLFSSSWRLGSSNSAVDVFILLAVVGSPSGASLGFIFTCLKLKCFLIPKWTILP